MCNCCIYTMIQSIHNGTLVPTTDQITIPHTFMAIN